MRKAFTLLLTGLLFVTVSAQEMTPEDLGMRWQALINSVDLDQSQLSASCPGFPLGIVEMEPADAGNAISTWLKAENEVDAFFAISEIKALNPAPGHFGIEMPDAPGVTHSYLQWIESSGMSLKDIRSFAPHFPMQNGQIENESDVEAYDEVLQDWMRLYPKELERFVNHPSLASKNPYYQPQEFQEHQSVERFLLMPCPDDKPERQDYASGNPAFDQERYELALQHWYYANDPDLYLELYDVESPHVPVEGSK